MRALLTDVASERKGLLSNLQKITAWDCKSLHILVTSRPEFDIKLALSALCTSQLCIQSDLIDPDIRTYIKKRLAQDTDLQKITPDMKSKIEDHLTKDYGGM